MRLPRATVIIVNTNELHHLKRCLPTVLSQRYDEYEVLVVDNASTDGSVGYLEEHFPEVRVIRNAQNLGYAGANNAGFANASGEVLVVLNPDTTVEPDWLRELVLALDTSPDAGLATSKVLIMDDANRINACGNQITFAAMTVSRGLKQPADRFDRPEVVSAVSGAAFAIKRSLLEQIGPFDESFFIYYEDTDLSLRAALAGYDCLYVPTSIVYHDFALHLNAWKFYLEERNRLYSWLKVFRWGTLVALLPTLLLAEVLAWGYALLHGTGHLRSKVQSYAWFFGHRRQIAAARRKTQAVRRVGDRQVLRKLSHRLTLTDTANRYLVVVAEAVVQPLLWVWGGICRTAVVW